MAICKVKKVNLFTHIELKDKVILELQKAGCIQITDVTTNLVTPDLLTYKKIKDTEIDSALVEVKYCIDYLSNFKDISKKSGKSVDPLKGIFDYKKLSFLFSHFDYKNIYRKCKELDGTLKELKNRENHLKNLREHLEEWKELDIKIEDLEGTKNTKLILGKIPLKNYIFCLEEIKKIGQEIEIKKIDKNNKQYKMIIISISEHYHSINKILNKYNFEYFKFPLEFSGTPKNILRDISEELKSIEKKREDISDISKKIYRENLSLYLAFDHLNICKSRKDIEIYLKQTQKVIIIEGWILEKDINKLKKQLFKENKELEMIFSNPKENDNIPVELINNKFIQPFESITELYGIPQYKEFDPTPLFAPFYFIFFGICLSDAGYGLIMAVLFYFALLSLNL